MPAIGKKYEPELTFDQKYARACLTPQNDVERAVWTQSYSATFVGLFAAACGAIFPDTPSEAETRRIGDQARDVADHAVLNIWPRPPLPVSDGG